MSLEPESRAAVRPRRALAAALLLLLGIVFAESAVAQPWRPGIRRPEGYLSGPRGGDAREVAEAFLRERHARFGIQAEDLDQWRLGDRLVSERSGVTHLHLRQQLGGIDVRGGDLTVNVMPDGRALGLRHRFVRRLARAANARLPRVTPRDAVEAAAGHLGLALREPLRVEARPGGVAREVVFSDGGISLDPIPVKLVFLRLDDEHMRLGWELFVRLPDQQHWWNLVVDAVTGDVLSQVNWIVSDSYNVHPLPFRAPDDGARSLQVDPADPTASPLGWHDDDGIVGADHDTTVGNNVIAQDDINGNNGLGARADGGPGRVFDFPLDFAAPAANSLDAALTNLFYWNNVLHDIHYAYGFDEASGNFQNDNYGKGGVGGDPVLADAQDGSSLNNANFSRAAEGFPPRMQLFLFQFPGLVISAPASIAQQVRGGQALFGGTPSTPGLTGSLVMAEPADACSPLTNGAAIAGNVALIDRGGCAFTVKVSNAQTAGAAAAVVANNVGNDIVTMSGSDPSISIVSLFIGQSHGDAIKGELAGGVTATITSSARRDSDFDNTIIAHEYGHGVSIRLSGGPSNVGCLSLQQSAGMGEGWSDWWALAMTATPGQQPGEPRTIGAWVQGEGPGGPGIRNFPYTTDTGLNPQTLSTITGTNQPHGVGEVWAQALWEIYWLLVGEYGYDPDLYAGTGGNNLALQLVTDALKQQPCEPTFLDARDAVFDADLAANGGANECLLWQGFAKRGLGEDAVVSGNPDQVTGVSDGFAVPAGCVPACGNGRVDLGESCDDSGTAGGDGCSAVCQVETFVSLFGTAQGGSVSLTVSGVVVNVTTSPGQGAEAVLQALVDAIVTDPTLSGLGVTAVLAGGQLATDGTLTDVDIADAGLSQTPGVTPVPTLGPAGVAALISAMATALLALTRRRDSLER